MSGLPPLKKYFLLSILIVLLLNMGVVSACKDIVATGDATAGNYNLLLKVRDPSRPDYQTLTIIPEGYEYRYHHPWTGKTMDFEFKHTTIGVTSVGDTIPNIIKQGMCFTSAGLAFGDADTVSNWKNPTKYGWDDFDWIRYAAQTARTEEEAIHLLTEEAVDALHAPAVPENLFLIGPNNGYVIEADVIHHVTNEVDGYVAISNYAKELWRKSLIYRAIAPSFDARFEGSVRQGRTIRLGLGSIFGIRIIDVGDDHITVKQVPIQFSKGNIIGRSFNLLETTRIDLQETEKIGFYRVNLIDIDDQRATISMCFEYQEWEELMHEIIQESYGHIDISDMMNWSRLHSSELNGLRGMCGEHTAYRYEGCMIYKIPDQDYDTISEGWFSANHACSSIYVPVHICDTNIYNPYETGMAAELSLDLLDTYGHGSLSSVFTQTEQVFIRELSLLEPSIQDLLDGQGNLDDFLSISDMGMQRQAYITQLLWKNVSTMNEQQELTDLLSGIWGHNYSRSLLNMRDIVITMHQQYDDRLKNSIIDLALSIVKTRIQMCQSIEVSFEDALILYDEAVNNFDQDSYNQGFAMLLESYNLANTHLKFISESITIQEKNEEKSSLLFLFSLLLISLFVLIFVGIRQGQKKQEKRS